jgi:outer membrane lipase/esterase
MMRSRLLRSVQLCALVLTVLSAALPASARQLTKLVVFGDSLSDTGAVFAVTQGAVPPSPPYYAGRFSNGPVWAEYLGAALDLPVENYAYGGAQTDHGNLFDGLFGIDFPGLSDEIELYLGQPGRVDRHAIYVVWAGANDFRAALARGETPDIAGMVSNLLNAIGALYLAGARYVVVPNLPDLGLTPEGRASGAGPLVTLLSETFNTHLEEALAVHAPQAIRLDVFRLMHKTVDDPSDYGLTNVTAPCLTSAGVCAAPDEYLFWDHVHPTTHGHAILARKLAKAINQAVVRHHHYHRR